MHFTLVKQSLPSESTQTRHASLLDRPAVHLELAPLSTNAKDLTVPISAEELVVTLLLALLRPLDTEERLLRASDVPNLERTVMSRGREEMGRGRVGADEWDLGSVRVGDREGDDGSLCVYAKSWIVWRRSVIAYLCQAHRKEGWQRDEISRSLFATHHHAYPRGRPSGPRATSQAETTRRRIGPYRGRSCPTALAIYWQGNRRWGQLRTSGSISWSTPATYLGQEVDLCLNVPSSDTSIPPARPDLLPLHASLVPNRLPHAPNMTPQDDLRGGPPPTLSNSLLLDDRLVEFAALDRKLGGLQRLGDLLRVRGPLGEGEDSESAVPRGG